MSLRGRFAAVSSGIALVTLTGSSSAVWLSYTAGQQRHLDTALLRQAEEDALRGGYVDDPPGSGRASLRHAELDSATTYAVVYDKNGQALVWTPNLQVAQPRSDLIRHGAALPFDLWWNNEHLRAVVAPIPGERQQLLWLATPRTDLDGDARDLARRMAIAVLAAVAVTAAAAWRLAGALTRDHDRIAAVARAVAAGDLTARIGMLSGDPEMARLGRDIDEMISRLAVLVETQQRFIANASHELRSPVTTMLGELAFALRREREASAYRESITEALASARRLRSLIEDLLALARIGSADFEPEPVLLCEVAQGVFQSSQTAAEATGVELQAACDDAIVEGHPGDLLRLVRNLVENAIRHSPRGGVVRVEAHPSTDGIRLLVSDEGPGVAPEVRERIFEPFFRSPSARADASGTGLGLAIARTIARAHGGDLWVDNAGQAPGARFVVSLRSSCRRFESTAVRSDA
jgi:two-component system OmpR family sensor kinase